MADIEQTNFLILDDIKSIRDQLVTHLKDMGAKNILQAENVAQGKKYIEEFPINFIISDWNMPGESGFDFLKFVRANPKFKQIPFILLTTVGEEDSVLDAVMNGASNYLLKPWNASDLGEKMKAAYKKHNPGKILF